MNVLFEQFRDYIEHYGAGMDIRLYNMGDFLGDSYAELDKNFWERSLKNPAKKRYGRFLQQFSIRH